ncbi:hypothetical protein J5N97_011061 [Dioscorea zingiberensis]|uniref:Uncharacterized protein n=1 Tax=Dioscorea zingiberensis TaxID=325984 RepID=A0A9D5CZX0_9LILI|nr:hypothetical protein J5N97_011061 [Dioscorea zingiberensis]
MSDPAQDGKYENRSRTMAPTHIKHASRGYHHYGYDQRPSFIQRWYNKSLCVLFESCYLSRQLHEMKSMVSGSNFVLLLFVVVVCLISVASVIPNRWIKAL